MIRSRKVPWKVLSLISIQNQWKPSGHQQPQRWGLCHVIGINTLRLRQNGCHFADNILKLIFLIACYASAFRRRRHYVFGLSVRPSVRSLNYPLLTCTWVRWSTRPTVTILQHVRPSVCPSVRRGFRAFAGERIEGMAWNFTCSCILTTFRTDQFMATVCWFL